MNARLFCRTRAASLPLPRPTSKVPQGRLSKRYTVVSPARCPLEWGRRDGTRQRISAIALLSLLGGQWLLPGAWLLGEARAADGRQQQRQQQTAQAKKAAQQRTVREAAARERKQPVPAWYRETRQEEQRLMKQVRLAQVQRTTTQKRTGAALGIAAAKNPAAGTTNTSAPVVGPSNPVTMQRMAQQQLALRAWLAKQPKRRPRAAKPGQVIPSAPLYVPNPLTSTKPIDLKNSRVPTQVEISQSGQMCGALAPSAEADVEKFGEQLDKELKALGIPEGLKATLPVTTPAGKVLFEKKERYKRAQLMNRDFALAMNLWNARNFAKAVPLMQEYAKEYPKSPWTLEALIHLADHAKYAGKPNEALMFYDQIIAASSPKPGTMSFEARQKAYERKADLFILQGRFSEARPMLADISKNDFHWRRRTWAAHWLHQVELMTSSRVATLALRDCGTKALAVVMDNLGKSAAARQLDAMKPTRTVGFSLLELQNLAGRHGVTMRGFRTKAEQLAKLPLPLVLHYAYESGKGTGNAPGVKTPTVKVREAEQGPGHFLVVQRIDQARGLVHLFNPQDQSRFILNYRDLDREWSGNGLAMVKSHTIAAKAAGVAWLSPREMKDVLGACFVVGEQSGLGCNENNDDVNGSCGSAGGGKGGEAGGKFGGGRPGGPQIAPTPPPMDKYNGSPVISVNRVSRNIFIADIPLWYRPAVGPPVEVTLSYNSQDASNYNTAFGNKWSFNYGSHIVENSAGRATIFMPDGRQDNYTPDGSGNFIPEKGIFNTLVKTGTLSYELRFPGGDKAIYGIPAGSGGQQPFLLELRDRWGKSLVFGYDSNIRLTTITDAQGKVTRLEWVSGAYGSRIARVTDPFERQASFSYDANGNMIECVDMEGNAFQYTYDDQVNVTQLNTAQGPWTFAYETLLNYATGVLIYNPMQDQPEKFSYSGHGDYRYTDHRGYATNYTVVRVRGTSSSGYENDSVEARVATVSYPGGDNYSYSYDLNSLNPSSITDPRGLVTNITYNAQGQPTQIQRQNPDPYAPDPAHTTIIAYATNGLDVTSITNARNETEFSATYNAQHQPTSVTDAANNTTTFTYTTWGAPQSVTDAENHVTVYNYDITSKRLTSISRDGSVLGSFTYDSIGRTRTSTDAVGLTLTYEYNNLDAITKVIYPDGTYSSIEYVCCGMPGVMRDRSGRKTYYDYDPLKRLIRTQDATGNVVNYDYDYDSNLIKLGDTKNNRTHWTYDGSSRPTRKTYADGTYDAYSYQNDRLTARRDGRGRVTGYGYDNWGRMSTIDYPTMPDVTISYDPLDRPTSITDGLGESTFGYDVVGQLNSVDGPFENDTVSYHYDDLNQRDWMKINGVNQTIYGYDALSRLQSIASAAGTFTYNYVGVSGMLQSLAMPNGTETNYTYDGLQRLTQMQTLVGQSNISSYAYAYDNQTHRPNRQGEVSQIETGNPLTRAYGYDDGDQITGETISQGGQTLTQTSLSYDPMGNRTSSQSTTATTQSTTNYTNNKLNQLIAFTTTTGQDTIQSTVSYDQSGNLTSITSGISGTVYSYDDENRLSTMEVPGESKSTFLYDALSRLRISRVFDWQNGAWVQTGEVRRIYDGMDVVQERDAQNDLICTYTRAGNLGGILARSDVTGHLFYHYDGRGNVSQLTDGSAQVQARYSYDALGNTSSSGMAANLNRYRFSTKEDVGGLYSFGYRFYSPSLGRWMNRDLIAESGGMNLYGFVGNDPVNDIDEYGLQGGRGNRKGQRGGTGGSSGSRTPNPYKHCKLDPTDANYIICKTPDGKSVRKKTPPDWYDYKKAVPCPNPWWRNAWDWYWEKIGDANDAIDNMPRIFPEPDPDAPTPIIPPIWPIWPGRGLPFPR